MENKHTVHLYCLPEDYQNFVDNAERIAKAVEMNVEIWYVEREKFK